MRRRGRLRSPLIRRVLAVNVLALVVLVAGLLYLGRYQDNLISSELDLLRSQAHLLAEATAELGTRGDRVGADGTLDITLDHIVMRSLVGRLSRGSDGARVRVFDVDGSLVADSRQMPGSGDLIEVEPLPPPTRTTFFDNLINQAYELLTIWLPSPARDGIYTELAAQRARQYGEVMDALAGRTSARVRATPREQLVLSVAAPVQAYRRVTGALMLSRDGENIDRAMRAIRLNILAVFAGALLVTVLLSAYLANTIARPVRRLAAAAESVRAGEGRRVEIPDLSMRGDEIGDLSISLREMTAALWQRMDAIEHFAADVAHEIKNPLTSLRSAVETAGRLEDPVQQRQLMSIVIDDVRRLDRLISDISNASRLDAELSRADRAQVDLNRMLATLVEIEQTLPGNGNEDEPAPRVVYDAPNEPLIVPGMEDRLVQVFRNLMANARSFSPDGGTITVSLRRHQGNVVAIVDDEGPGLPPGKEETIFERFYSERPRAEKFGLHSGLGLAISRQIVEAHGGHIHAQTRRNAAEEALGARFTVSLPGTG